MAATERTGLFFLPAVGGLFTTLSFATSAWGFMRRWGLDPTTLVLGAGGVEGAVKAVFLKSLTSMLAVGAANLATSTFMGLFQTSATQGALQTLQTAFWTRAPSPHGGALPPPSPQQQRQWDALRALGGARDAVHTLSRYSTAVMLFLLSLTLQYLHVIGAYEMRRKLQARAATQATTASPTVDAETSTVRAYANAQAARAALSAKDKAASNQVVHDAEAFQAPDDVLESVLRGFYLNDRFYNPALPGPASASFLTVTPLRVNPVRVVMNILLGFSMQLNAMFTGSAQLSGTDPIPLAARTAAVIAYWELLARALQLYGWAPVYVAVERVTRMLMAAPRTPARYKKR